MSSDKKNIENEEKIEDKLQYKQIVFIVLLTVIMVLSSLTLSFSAVKMLSNGKNMNYNSLIVKVPPTTTDPSDEPIDNIIFNYKEVELIGNGIYMTNMDPTEDEVGKSFMGAKNTFQFKLYFGKKALNYYYEITAEKLSMSTLDGKYVKLYLESESKPVISTLKNNVVKSFEEYDNGTVNVDNNDEKIIYSGTVSKDDIAKGHKDFTLRMWLSGQTPMNSETSDKTFAVRVNVYAK